MELIGTEIKCAGCLWRREGEHSILHGENSQCADRLCCLIEVKALLTSHEVLLVDGKRPDCRRLRQVPGINGREDVLDNHMRDSSGMEDSSRNRDRSASRERENACRLLCSRWMTITGYGRRSTHHWPRRRNSDRCSLVPAD